MNDAATEHPFEGSDAVFEASMPSCLADRQRVIDGVLEALEKQGCRLDLFFDRLCLDEIISNAIIHGNKEDPAKAVTVRAFCDTHRLGFEIKDEGDGFDWRAVKEAFKKPPDSTKTSGRGLALIHAAGSSVYFLDGGRCVVVTRNLASLPRD